MSGMEEHMAKFISPAVLFSGSHTDHGLQPQHWGFLLDVAGSHVEECGDALISLIRTVVLPEGCPDINNALYGPACGDPEVKDNEVVLESRNGRPWVDRMIDRPSRPSRLLTIIAVPEWRGEEAGRRLVVFTAYGGPAAPQNPADPSNKDVEGARRFWSQHALAR